MKKFNSSLLITSVLFSNILLAEDIDILSPTKKEILEHSYNKAIEDSSKLKKDWINPFSYKYIYNNGEEYTTKRSFISISQPIFKSGGIYYAIKYANSIEKASKISIELQKKELIKQAVNILFQIEKIDINIKKQKLLISNSNLDITRKQDQVLNGLLDTSFLDNAILDANSKKNILIDLEYQKEELINNFNILSNKSHKELQTPRFTLLTDNKFLNKNLYLKQATEDIDSSYWVKNMTLSSYLPTVNFTADYTKYHDTGENPMLTKEGNSNIGFNITIPFDLRMSNSIQSSKIEYLQKKASLEDKKQQELILYKNSLSKIKHLDKKVILAKENLKLYDSLLVQLKEQYEVGMKTISDVETMQNSKEIKKLELESLNIDKQLELLEIYARVSNE